MIRIICGTNRRDSITRRIANQYAEILNERGEESEIIDLNLLPTDFIISALYENAGKNTEFNYFSDKMVEAQKFVFIIPEYNGSFPGVLKAFIDGLPYPGAFHNKKCALVGISSGAQGAGLALSHLTDIFNYMGMHVLAYKAKFAQIEGLMSEDKITHPGHLKKITKQAQMLIDF